VKRYTGTLVYAYTRECVNLVIHTNFTVLRVIEADFWSTRSMREQVYGELERMLTKFDEITNVTAITPLKVIWGHRF